MCTTCGCGQPDHVHHHHDHRHEETLNLEADILGENNRHAAYNRGYLNGRGVKAFNFVSSPGSGKTALLEAIAAKLRNRKRLYVIEGDQATDNDAERVRRAGVEAVQINTQNGCHLDAHMVCHALEELNPVSGSVVVIENVGNLVCPAMFDLGEDCRVVVLSVTEGDDKPLKYPFMFEGSAACIINKIDLLPYLDTDVERIKANLLKVNPHLKIFTASATHGDGLDAIVDWLCE